MNDEDRRAWVMADEAMYVWWRKSGRPITAFVRENRRALTEAIEKTLNGERQEHSGPTGGYLV